MSLLEHEKWERGHQLNIIEMLHQSSYVIIERAKSFHFLLVLWSQKEGKNKKSITGYLNINEGTYPSFASTVSGARIEHLEKSPLA